MGVSFVSIFILTYHIFFWVCGLAHSLSWDYAPDVPQGEAANTRVSWREKPIGGFIWRHILKRADYKNGSQGPKSAGSPCHPRVQIELGIQRTPIKTVRRTPRCSACSSQACQATLPVPALTQPEVPSLSKRVLAAIAVAVTPISVVVAISLLVALVDPLKGLFVDFEGGPSWEGPDGKPPLAFVIDTGPFFSSPFPAEFSDNSFDRGKPS